MHSNIRSEEISSLKPWRFDKKTQDPRVLWAYLASANTPTPSIGCITYEYIDGAKLSMICFKDDQVYHLITTDEATYPDTIPDELTLYQYNDKPYKL